MWEYMLAFVLGGIIGDAVQQRLLRWVRNLGEEVDLLDLEPHVRTQVLALVYDEDRR